MYERILVAVDGSASSMNALRQSFRMTKNRITVVSIAPLYEGDVALTEVGPIGADIQSVLRAPCDQALANAEEMAKQEGASIKTLCELGQSYKGIVSRAEVEGCDLIVMGRSGVGRVQRALMGSVTARVIGYSPIDVLVVPEGSMIGWKKVLLATDGSDYSKKAAIRAMELTNACGGELEVVSVVDSSSEFYTGAPEISEKLTEQAGNCVAHVEEQAAKMDMKVECIVREGSAYKAIVDVAKEMKVDVIVMGSHGRTGLKRLLMGSVTEGVIGHSPCPVLVVKRLRILPGQS